MPLLSLPYKSLDELIKKSLATKEDPETASLIRQLIPSRKKGWLTKTDLINICKWKSPRAIHLIKSNSSQEIRRITKEALGEPFEKRKMELLTSLNGVSIPMASSILMLLYPKKYGVIDIRVWETLYSLKSVNSKPKGVGFRFNNWYVLLSILRFYSTKYKTSVRMIEYTIFLEHQKYQDGPLYRNL